MKKKQTKPKCPYCFDKKFYTQATGGNVAMGDFVGDKSYKVPLEIVKIPCPKCKVNSSKQADDGMEKQIIYFSKINNGDWRDFDTDNGIIEFRNKSGEPFDIEAFLATLADKAYQQGRKDALRQVANEVATSFWIDNKSAQKLLKKLNQVID